MAPSSIVALAISFRRDIVTDDPQGAVVDQLAEDVKGTIQELRELALTSPAAADSGLGRGSAGGRSA